MRKEMDGQGSKEISMAPEVEKLEAFTDGFVEGIARRHGVPEDNPGKVKDVLEAASQVSFENLPEDKLPKGLPGKFIEAAVRVETVTQNLPLSPKQREFAKGLEENFKGAAGFFSSVGEKAKEFFPKEKGNIARKAATSLLVAQMALSACNPVNSPKTPDAAFTQTPVSTETFAPTPTEILTPVPTEIATEVIEGRGMVTAENTKNIEPISLLTADSFGKLSGFPEGTSAEIQSEASLQYLAVQKKFPTSSVYFAHDAQSGQWLLFSEMAGNIFYSTASDAGGNEIYSDYPLAFNEDDTGVVGNYSLLAMPGEIGVIWKNGLPQLVAGKVKLASGDTYYKEYLDYSVQVNGGSPWKEIPGVAQMVEAEAPKYEPGTVTLNPDYDFGGQVELIAENNQAFYDNFLDSLIRINRGYFKALQTKNGDPVTSTETLKTYLKENDWLVPPGLQIPIRSARYGDVYVELSEPISEKVSLKNLDISFIQISEYNFVKNSYINANYLFSIKGGGVGLTNIKGLGFGFAIHKNEDHYTLSLIIARRTANENVDFPQEGQALSEGDIKQMNDYLRFILYVTRALQKYPPTQLGAELYPAHPHPFTFKIDPNTGVGVMDSTDNIFVDFVQHPVSDSAPEIVKLK